jgi:integrase
MDIPKQDRLVLAILACTGARLDEIALLTWGQVHENKTKDNHLVHWLDTTQAIVKNEASKRLIPIVPRVWKLIRAHRVYANSKEPERLFTYGRDKDGKAENKASRAIMPHIRKISMDGTFAIHSLRHTFNTMCREAGIDWELREFIQGRSGQGEGAKYGRPTWVAKQLEEIGKIDYSFLDGNLSISSVT